MLLQRFTNFVLRSRLHAVGTAFVLSLAPLFGASVGILVATFITLRKGAFEGALVLCVTIAASLLNYALSSAAAQPQVVTVVIATIIAINILTWLLALVLRRYENWNLVLDVAILTGLVFVFVVHFVFPGIQNEWNTQLTAYLNKTASVFEQLAPDAAGQEEMQASMVASIKPYLTGFVIASIVFNALFQLVLARWWQAIVFNPGGLRRELHQIRLSYVSASVFIAVLGLAYIGNAFGLDMLPMMVVAFCAAGLSLIHRMLASNKTGWFWLLLVYLGIMFVFPAGMVLVAIAGLLDSLFNLRLRFKN